MSDPDIKKRKTDMYCHECKNDFLAELDYGLNGNHEIVCPHCKHIHYRVIEDGEVTSERYKSSMGMIYTCNTWTTNSTATYTYNTSSNSTDTTTYTFSTTYNVNRSKTDGWTYVKDSWNNTVKG